MIDEFKIKRTDLSNKKTTEIDNTDDVLKTIIEIANYFGTDDESVVQMFNENGFFENKPFSF